MTRPTKHPRARAPHGTTGAPAPDGSPSTDTYISRHRPRRSRPASSPGNPFDDDPPPPTTPVAIALPRPVPPPADAVASPRFIPGFDPKILFLPPRIGNITPGFLSVDMPRMNTAVKRGELSSEALATAITDRLNRADLNAIARTIGRMRLADAYYVHGALSMIAASIVHHVRVETGDRETSDGLALIPGLEQTLLVCARITKLPPRDCAFKTWLIGGPWTFTGSEGEVRFGRAVRDAEAILGEAVDLLADLREGRVPLRSAAGAIEYAADRVAAYRKVQADLSGRPFGKEFLAMRNYLAPYQVGGKRWEGSNATYTRAWTEIDLATGLLGRPFYRIVRMRAAFMPPWDCERLLRSLEQPSLCDLIADALGMCRTQFAAASDEELRALSSTASPALQPALRAAARLAWEVAKLAAVHMGAIVKNLTKPAQALTEEERGALVTPVDSGVGGNHLNNTQMLMTQRITRPMAKWGKAQETAK